MIFVIAGIAAVCAFVWHGNLASKFWVATVASAATSSLLFYAIASSHFGWMDNTFVENALITFITSLFVSIVVGKIIHHRIDKMTHRE